MCLFRSQRKRRMKPANCRRSFDVEGWRKRRLAGKGRGYDTGRSGSGEGSDVAIRRRGIPSQEEVADDL